MELLNNGGWRLADQEKKFGKKYGAAAQCRKDWKKKLRGRNFGQIFLFCSERRLVDFPDRDSQRRD